MISNMENSKVQKPSFLAGIISADAFVYPTASHAFNLTCDACSDSTQIFLAEGDCEVRGCQSTGCACTIKVADGFFVGKLDKKNSKASQNPRAYLQSAGSGITSLHINCQIHA